MGEIDFTNIIIDDFRKGKLNPFNRYLYILTHIHSDHLKGLSNSWDYGIIYCSQITANLILNKFPNLKHSIKVLPLQEPSKLILADNIVATVTFFDANHCAGSVMVLLQGYFGRFLYTGDFRFDRNKFSSYSYLYPPQNSNQQFEGCSKSIDKMWLDNTFCNPKYNFLAQKQALQLVTNFVKQTQQKIYIGMDYYGKQQVLIHLAKQLQIIIVVDQQRYETIIVMQLDRQLFTTNPEQGRIQVVPKIKLHDKLLQNPQSIGLVMSGWCIKKQWKKVRGTNDLRILYVPYSLHSNYNQLVSFVKSIKPSIIQPIVHYHDNISGNISSDQMYNTTGNLQSFQSLVSQYTSPISLVYNRNLNDKQFQKTLKKKLKLDLKTQQINKKQLGLDTIYLPSKGKGYKINHQRNQDQINKVKQYYLSCKNQKIKDKSIVIDQNQWSQSDVQIVEQKINKFYSNYSINKQKIINTQKKIGNVQIEEEEYMVKKLELKKIQKINIIKGEEIKEMFREQLLKLISSLK